MPIQVEKLRIILYPDPRLRQRATPIDRFDDELARVAGRMIELMGVEEGVGLAAPQLGLSMRLFIAQPDRQAPPNAFVNPTLTLGDEEDVREEGCLSVPEVHVMIRRSIKAEISAMDLSGQPIKLSGEGFVARIWQHEFDHLEGRLITQRMSETERIENRKKLREMEREFEKARRK